MPRQLLKKRPSAKKTQIPLFRPPIGNPAAVALWLVCCAILYMGYQPLGTWRFAIASGVLVAFLLVIYRREILIRTGFQLSYPALSGILSAFLVLLLVDAGILNSLIRNQGFDIQISYGLSGRLGIYTRIFCQVLNEEIVLRVLLLSLLMRWFRKPIWSALIGSGIGALVHALFYLYGSGIFLGWESLASLFFYNAALNILFLCFGHNGFGMASHLAWNFNRFGMGVSKDGVGLWESKSFAVFEGSGLVLIICILLGTLIVAFYSQKEAKALALGFVVPTKSEGPKLSEALSRGLKWVFILMLVPSSFAAGCLVADMIAIGAPYRDPASAAIFGSVLAIILAMLFTRLVNKWGRLLMGTAGAFAAVLSYSLVSYQGLKQLTLWTLDDLRHRGHPLSYQDWAQTQPPRSPAANDFVIFLENYKGSIDEEFWDFTEKYDQAGELGPALLAQIDSKKQIVAQAGALLDQMEPTYFFNPMKADASFLGLTSHEYGGNLVLARLMTLFMRRDAQTGETAMALTYLDRILKLGKILSNHPLIVDKMIGRAILRIAFQGVAKSSSYPHMQTGLVAMYPQIYESVAENVVIQSFSTELIHLTLMVQKIIDYGGIGYSVQLNKEIPGFWEPSPLQRAAEWMTHILGHDMASFIRYMRLHARVATVADPLASDPLRAMRVAARSDQFQNNSDDGMPSMLDLYEKMLEREKAIRTEALLLNVVLASQKYRHQKGDWPKKPSDLVNLVKNPKDLLDPIDGIGASIRFRLKEGGLLIYTIDIDEKDDGGNLDKRVDLGYFLSA